jgi:hypothetical protein
MFGARAKTSTGVDSCGNLAKANSPFLNCRQMITAVT